MIEVRVRQDSLSLSGHAGYGPRGQSIVCAAVSAITLTMIEGLREIAGIRLTEIVDMPSRVSAGLSM